jgi:hypothetical protein
MAATVETSDLGEYRAYWITPGRYYLSAWGGSDGPLPWRFDGRNGMLENYPETFFPGVTDISQARVVDLEEGADLRAVDFTLYRQQQSYRVRGRVVDGATGRAPGDAMIFFGGGSNPRSYNQATGTFELPNMTPGRHGIMARLGGLDASMASTAPWVFTTVIVADYSVDNLVLRIPPPIEGQIRVDGQSPLTTPLGQVRVQLVPVFKHADLPLPLTPSAVADADGKFRISVPLDGEYRVKVSRLPASGFYVKEARLSDVDVLQSGARFSATGRLDILLSPNAGEVSGRVLRDNMEPARSAQVVLVPGEPRNRVELFRRITVLNGQFRIQGVAPGDYKIFAWQGIEENAYFDTELLKRFENRGVSVRIRELSRETVDVRLIPETLSP